MIGIAVPGNIKKKEFEKLEKYQGPLSGGVASTDPRNNIKKLCLFFLYIYT